MENTKERAKIGCLSSGLLIIATILGGFAVAHEVYYALTNSDYENRIEIIAIGLWFLAMGLSPFLHFRVVIIGAFALLPMAFAIGGLEKGYFEFRRTIQPVTRQESPFEFWSIFAFLILAFVVVTAWALRTKPKEPNN